MPHEEWLIAGEEDHGKRLDKWLSERAENLTRSRAQQLIAEGHVRSGEGRVLSDASAKIRLDMKVCVDFPKPQPLALTPEAIALHIIYEDDDIIVINKPVGMTVHPAPGAREGTLVHALLAHCGDSLSGIGGVMRPGIVHRIDKDTSGLLVVAKHDAAHQHLAAQLKDRSLKRTYLAWVWGAPYPSCGTIDAPIARHPVHRKKMAVVEGGRQAITHYRTRTHYALSGTAAMMACLELQLQTGRTHQIRVHLSHLGHGLLGDGTYGISTATRLARLKSARMQVPEALEAALRGFNRQALHAAALGLMHPRTGTPMTFEAPLPTDMQALQETLNSLTNAKDLLTFQR